ncbi:MAG TPA: ParB/RepB/Spo0J family partition protein [Bacteroidales bacterium]|nr:ParB/RepB/Spo0J family partition protein [Bacteroidales bacterium]
MNTIDIPLSKLEVSAFNTRKDLDAGQEDSGIQELSTSIQKKGLIQPLIVRPMSNGNYEVISGQRRLKACRRIDFKTVPCIVRENIDNTDAMTLSLIENIHRADMNPMDKANTINILYEKYGSQKKVSDETGWSSSTISKYLSLIKLPDEIKNKITTSESAAKITALSRLAKTFSGKEALDVYEKINGFNQRIQEEIIKQSKGDPSQIDGLVNEVQEGVFDVRHCGGLYGCEIIKEIIEGKMDEKEFEKIISLTAKNIGDIALDETLRKSAKTFWKSLVK